MKNLKNVKGITLIALVITIIILLILAGVTINVAIRDNGLFKKSKQAVEKYKEAEKNETEVLENMSDEIAKIDILKKVTGEETVNTKVTIDGQNVWIPAGFKISDETAGEVSRGIVVEDKNGNQFVWVPCYIPAGEGETETKIEKEAKAKGYPEFNRYDFGIQYGSNSDYSEEMSADQRASIKTYGGFYIGRYEAGDKETTDLGLLRKEQGSNITVENGDVVGDDKNTVVIKKNQAPYNFISCSQCKALSENFGGKNEYKTDKIFTTLCSSYAWDTTLQFIEKTNAGYATNLTGYGNNYDHQFSDSLGIIKTGLTKSVCNIYDMEGNLAEFTTESYRDVLPVQRQSTYYGNYPAGNRSCYSAACYDIGFRIALFLNK